MWQDVAQETKLSRVRRVRAGTATLNGNLDIDRAPEHFAQGCENHTGLQFSLAEGGRNMMRKACRDANEIIGASDQKTCALARSQLSSDERLLGDGSLQKSEALKTTARRLARTHSTQR